MGPMDARLRMLDASANRAREALRVMEDIARFALDDESLCRELKEIRHGLRGALEQALGTGAEAAMLAWRDAPGDVGTQVATDAEGRRDDLRAVGAAAGKRLSEALRSMEEVCKTFDGPGAAMLERLRYAGYEAERRLLSAMGTGRGVQWRLCVLITQSLCTHHSWEEVARGAIEGGADCVQLREKKLPDQELVRRAGRLVDLARSHRVDGRAASVIINDRADVALVAGADGVHLGQDDLPLREARRMVGANLLVGVSTHTIAQARQAAMGGADYCGVGPMFETGTKDAGPIAGRAYLREYLATPQTARVPHLAIGGITVENIGQLSAAGCRGVAVSSAVCGARDPRAVCETLVRAMGPPGSCQVQKHNARQFMPGVALGYRPDALGRCREAA